MFVPVFFIRIDTEYVSPADIEEGKFELITGEFLSVPVTVTVLVVVAPNHATPSCTILYDGLKVPGPGAVILKMKIYSCHGQQLFPSVF